MYCINCGVKLAPSEKKCPLCGVRVFHPELPQPDGAPTYPRDVLPPAPSSSKGAQVVVAALFLLTAVILLLCDLHLESRLGWAGYAIGALVVVYVCTMLPTWFRKPNPVIFVPCGFASVALYLLYINWEVGGNWFLSFALPVVGAVCLIVTAVITLVRYVRRGLLYIYGGAFLALGAFMPLMEYLMVYTFGYSRMIWWSLYPLSVLTVLGGLLLFFAIYRPARQIMERKFFL